MRLLFLHYLAFGKTVVFDRSTSSDIVSLFAVTSLLLPTQKESCDTILTRSKLYTKLQKQAIKVSPPHILHDCGLDGELFSGRPLSTIHQTQPVHHVAATPTFLSVSTTI